MVVKVIFVARQAHTHTLRNLHAIRAGRQANKGYRQSREDRGRGEGERNIVDDKGQSPFLATQQHPPKKKEEKTTTTTAVEIANALCVYCTHTNRH